MISDHFYSLLSVDFPPLLASILACLSCGILGNFLVLRRLSLMGDAISHAILPGLVISFLITGQRSSIAMLAGAAVSGLCTVVLIDLVKRLVRVEPGAAMGVIFSVLFALGVLLIESASARSVDLDADCLLYGQIEGLFWLPPRSVTDLLSLQTLTLLPAQVGVLCAVLLAVSLFVLLCFKELRILSFDPALAISFGPGAGRLHYVLMLFVAFTTVASFEAAGSILVIGMLIGPAATARLLTDRLETQVLVSMVVAVLTALVGYAAATALPAALSFPSVSVSGSIVVCSAFGLVFAALFSPSHGVLTSAVRRRRLSRKIALDDLLGALFRLNEVDVPSPSRERLSHMLLSSSLEGALFDGASFGLLVEQEGRITLTESGITAARDIVRRHRLWESYLSSEANIAPADVHPSAERLEHLEIEPPVLSERDPHGREIPISREPLKK